MTRYAVVLIGGATGTVTLRPEGPDASQVRFKANTTVPVTATDRVIVTDVMPPGSMPCVIGVVQ